MEKETDSDCYIIQTETNIKDFSLITKNTVKVTKNSKTITAKEVVLLMGKRVDMGQ